MGIVVHRLSNVTDLPDASGSFKTAGYEDSELILDWTFQFRRETETGDHSIREEVMGMVRSKISEEAFFMDGLGCGSQRGGD